MFAKGTEISNDEQVAAAAPESRRANRGRVVVGSLGAKFVCGSGPPVHAGWHGGRFTTAMVLLG